MGRAGVSVSLRRPVTRQYAQGRARHVACIYGCILRLSWGSPVRHTPRVGHFKVIRKGAVTGRGAHSTRRNLSATSAFRKHSAVPTRTSLFWTHSFHSSWVHADFASPKMRSIRGAAPPTWQWAWQYADCCTTSGLVGTMNATFFLGERSRWWSISRAATFVP